jgi:GNAT superfamily N-acetyltransferase
MDPNFRIRPMTRPELDLVMDWAAAEGWNPGRRDADCFWACDPHGFFLGVLDRKPVASIAAVALDESFGFLSFYYVKPEHRGRGLGLQIWQAGMDYLGERNVGLDAVPAQEENYRRSGFQTAYHNLYYWARGGGPALPEAVPLSGVPFDDLAAYDARFFPSPRPNFLRCWVDQPQGAALGVLSGGRLRGYGVLRPCRRGFKLAPLMADDEETAMVLFQALIAAAPGAPVFLNIPEINPRGLALARKLDLNHVFTTARMYNREQPRVPLEGLYAHDIF